MISVLITMFTVGFAVMFAVGVAALIAQWISVVVSVQLGVIKTKEQFWKEMIPFKGTHNLLTLVSKKFRDLK